MGASMNTGTDPRALPLTASAPVRLPVAIDRVDDRAARMLGCTPAHAKRLRLTLAEIANTLCVAMRDNPVMRERFLRDLRTVGTDAGLLADAADLEASAQVADLTEDMAQHAYNLAPSRETLAAWIRAKERAVALETAALVALRLAARGVPHIHLHPPRVAS